MRANGPGREDRARSGQAMTEFVIAASAILVPLFLVIPFLGKIGELRQNAIQAARYQAWEYTVWNDPLSDYRDRNNGRAEGQSPTLPARDRGVVNGSQTSELFLYQRPTIGSAASQSSELRNGWSDVYEDAPANRTFASADGETPDPTTIVSDLIGVVDAIFSVFTTLNNTFNGLNLPTFRKLNGDGWQTSEVQLGVAYNYPLSPFVEPPTGTTGSDRISATITARAAVLTDSWGASSKFDAEQQVRGLVPTSLLGGTVGDVLQSLAGTFLLPFGQVFGGDDGTSRADYTPLPELARPQGERYLEFGIVDFEPLPPGAFENDDREVTCGVDGNNGRYNGPSPDPRVCGFREDQSP